LPEVADIKLFAVYLGGRAPKGNTEIHDVVFVTGRAIEDTYEQLMDKWLGTPKGLHIDSWIELDVVDGFKVAVVPDKDAGAKRLYFVNLGAYSDGAFTEIHASKFLVAETMFEAKARAKKELLKGWPSPVHTDDLYEIDDCIEIGRIDTLHVALEKTDRIENLRPTNGYHVIPEGMVEDYMRRKNIVELPKRGGYEG
jgi:hypothetical protein